MKKLNQNSKNNSLENLDIKTMENNLTRNIINEIDDKHSKTIEFISRKMIEIIEKASENNLSLNKTLNEQSNLIDKKMNENKENVMVQFAELKDNVNKLIINFQTELTKNTTNQLNIIKNGIDEYFEKNLNDKITKNFDDLANKITMLDNNVVKMETLQKGVDDLTKIMSGTKSRGNLGEYHLDNILNDQLGADYIKQLLVEKKESGKNYADFAIPYRREDEVKYLIIDSKFPLENYNFYNKAENQEEEKKAFKAIQNDINEMAKQIKIKYLDAENTLDYGLLYIPSESLFALVYTDMNFCGKIRQKYNVIIVGPATVSSYILFSKYLSLDQILKKNTDFLRKIFDEIKGSYEQVNKRLDEAESSANNVVTKVNAARKHVDSVNKKLVAKNAIAIENAFKQIESESNKSSKDKNE
ncbi:UNVERIFIED_CONTAM: DNA recombination protein RmuC [Campylobacter lari]